MQANRSNIHIIDDEFPRDIGHSKNGLDQRRLPRSSSPYDPYFLVSFDVKSESLQD